MYNGSEASDTPADQSTVTLRTTDRGGVAYSAAPLNVPAGQTSYGGHTSYLPLPNIQSAPTARSSSELPTTPFIPPSSLRVQYPSSSSNIPTTSSQNVGHTHLMPKGYFSRLLPPSQAARPGPNGWTTFGSLGLQEQIGSSTVPPPAMPFAAAQPAWQDVASSQQSIDFDWGYGGPTSEDAPFGVYMEGVHNFAGYGPAPTWSS